MYKIIEVHSINKGKVHSVNKVYWYFIVTFNTISVKSWMSALLENTEKFICLQPICNKIEHTNKYTSPRAVFKLKISVVIDIDCIGMCISNYHMITTTTAPSV